MSSHTSIYNVKHVINVSDDILSLDWGVVTGESTTPECLCHACALHHTCSTAENETKTGRGATQHCSHHWGFALPRIASLCQFPKQYTSNYSLLSYITLYAFESIIHFDR